MRRQDSDAARAEGHKIGSRVRNGATGVDDVVHHENRASLDRLTHVAELLRHRRLVVLVAGLMEGAQLGRTTDEALEVLGPLDGTEIRADDHERVALVSSPGAAEGGEEEGAGQMRDADPLIEPLNLCRVQIDGDDAAQAVEGLEDGREALGHDRLAALGLTV